MRNLAFFAAFPIVAGLALYYLRPDLLIADELSTVAAFWFLLGMLLTSWSVLFSAYALVEVKRLTDRYFVKQRLPEIRNQTEKVRKKMSELSHFSLREVRADGILGQVRVLLKQLERTKTRGFSDVLRRAKQELAGLEQQVKNGGEQETKVNSLDVYWDLSSTLSELSDEISAYDMESRAML